MENGPRLQPTGSYGGAPTPPPQHHQQSPLGSSLPNGGHLLSTPHSAAARSAGGAGHHLNTHFSVLTMDTGSRGSSVGQPSVGGDSPPHHAGGRSHLAGPGSVSFGHQGALVPSSSSASASAAAAQGGGAQQGAGAALSTVDLAASLPGAPRGLQVNAGAGAGGGQGGSSQGGGALRTHKSGGGHPGSPSFRQHRHPFFIGVAGGTASGKTTVCDQIMQRLHDQCVVMLAQDSFYRGLTPAELADVKNFNFDHPDAIDVAALVQALMDLRLGQAIDVPIYDFASHQRSDQVQRMKAADVVIVEGILVLALEEVRNLLHMKIFVDLDDDVRLARRIQRDVAQRGRDVAGVIEQYTRFVKPAFDQWIGPSRRFADVIIPWQRGDNIVAIDLITEHIRLKLQQHDLLRIYPNLEVLPSNFQIKGMHTILRDRLTSKNDFVFYSNRLNRLVVEHGLGHLPFTEKTVITPTGHPYVGVDFAKGLCGVSVIRSGEAMEAALRECCQGIKIGKILVHRHGKDGELVYHKLPSDVRRKIAGRFVLLMDPVLGTGNTACKAIQVLLEKGVDESKVMLLSLMAAPEGIHKVCRTYPRLRIVTSEIDERVDENWQVVPGVGEFGDRFFCA